MISPFMSFRTETMDPAKLEQVLSRYLTYERLRWFRSRLLPRFAMLLLACWALTTMAPRAAAGRAANSRDSRRRDDCGMLSWRNSCARRQLVRELREACRSRIFMAFLCHLKVFKIQTPFVPGPRDPS